MPASPKRVQRSESAPSGLRKHKAHSAESAATNAASASLQRGLFQRGRATPADLISAQRSMGNRALQRMLSEATPGKAQNLNHLSPQKQEEHALTQAAEHNEAANPEVLGKVEEERGGGRPLDSRVSKHVGKKLGADFSGVRIHTDPRSDLLNRVFKSKAFTVGRDIFFSRNAYRPGDMKAQRLIAHELIHVVQQGGDKSENVQAKFAVAPAADQYEREADRATGKVAPRRLDPVPESRPTAGLTHAGPVPTTDRRSLQPGSRAGVVQRAKEDTSSILTDKKRLPDLRKGDVIMVRQQLLDQKKDLRDLVQRTPYDKQQTIDLTKTGGSVGPGMAYDMVRRLWEGREKVMKPDFGYSALAVDNHEIAHTEDGRTIHNDPEEMLEGSEVYRSNDKKLSEKAVEGTKKWHEVEGKLNRAYRKAMTAEFDLTSQSKRQAAVLAAYALAGKLKPRELFSGEFTAMAHQAAALMPAIKQLIEAEGKGKRGRNSWGKSKDSKDGAKKWVERNLSRIKLPANVGGLTPAKIKPEQMPAAMHFLNTRNRPKWTFEGIL